MHRVLLIEDDRAVREALLLALRRHGHDVRATATGEDGLTQLRGAPTDIVVLDLMLPGIDGFEVCRRIRAAGTVPIIMLTARNDDLDVVSGLEAGADDYVSKPIQPRVLDARIRAVLRRRDREPEGRGPEGRDDARDPTGLSAHSLPVVGATAGLPGVARAGTINGRFFDAGHVDRSDRVAVLGEAAAKLLGVTRLDRAPAIFVEGRAPTVIGVLGGITRQPSLSTSVIVPHSTAATLFDLGSVRRVLITTELGAAQLIAGQAPHVLSPNDAARLEISAPPDPESLRRQIQRDVNGLFLVLGLVSLVVGAVGIANVTLVTVLERIGEIGLRRSLGAARRHIGLQFLAESTLIGLMGGIVGASVGIITVVTIAIAQGWTPVLDQRLALGAPPVGAIVGLLAGLYPAMRAARMEPVDALRSGT